MSGKWEVASSIWKLEVFPELYFILSSSEELSKI